jgi:hypothetical protein
MLFSVPPPVLTMADKNWLTASEVERRLALLGIANRFDPKEKAHLDTTQVIDLPRDVIGFPIPEHNSGLNILNLRKICGVDPLRQPSFFDHPWYLEEPFAAEDCEPGWHFIQAQVLPESISQPFHYARSLEARGVFLPSAIEVTLMLFLHYAANREQLLQKKHTWCRDVASLDRFVTVGAFGRSGLFVSGHPADFASRGLGICGKFRI